MKPTLLKLGTKTYELTTRALVVGILNRTLDSFYDQGRYFLWDAFLKRAEQLVEEGADILEIGGIKAGPGVEISEEEELERVVPAVSAICDRFEIPVSVDTWKATVADESFKAGAVLGNDISGFSDPKYLDVAARRHASVVACHIRLATRIPDPSPFYDDVVAEVSSFLSALAKRAIDAGVDRQRIVLDAALDLGKTAEQSLCLLKATHTFVDLGYPVMVAASNKGFLGELLGLDINARREASLVAAGLGIVRGARLLRVHDVVGTKRVVEMMQAILEAN